MLKQLALCFTCAVCALSARAQILTHEDSLSAGLNVRGNKATAISGYGEIKYQQLFHNKTAVATLQRAVLFIGHRFSDKITFFSEWELENAKVSGNQASGEFSMEQCFLKFDLNRNIYINAGFFTPRIGIINENHLPNTYNGIERPITEQIVIPATWRDIGVGLYGRSRAIPGLNYSIAILNGLNAAGFSNQFGIKDGRYEGFNASARNKAITAALLYYYGGWRLQASSYIGGSVGLDDTTASRLALSTGFFGTPVYLNEVNVQYRQKGLALKALACRIDIPDAHRINSAYANNTPEQIFGAYAEVGFDWLYKTKKQEKQFITFARYERTDMNAKIPSNGLANKAFTQNHFIAGITYLPHRGVAIKADYKQTMTGNYNTAFVITPTPYQPIWYKNQRYLSLGVTYSF